MQIRPFPKSLTALIALSALLIIVGNRPLLAQDERPLAMGTAAPDFTTKTLDGKPLALHSLRGKVVLLDFWATWCTFCTLSLPTIKSLDKHFSHQGLTVVGMSLDEADTGAQVRPYVHKHHIRYAISYAPEANNAAAMAYRINLDPNSDPPLVNDHPIPPATVLIDRKGRIRWSQVGYNEKEGHELRVEIKKLLAEH